MARGRTKRSRRDEPTGDTPDPQEQDIERLREENDRLRKLLEEYAKRIAVLKRQLALQQQNSTVTSKPPSSDGLAGQQRERGRRTKSRRKAGGQPGHPGRHRELVASSGWTPSWISRRRHVATARAACTRATPSGSRAGIR